MKKEVFVGLDYFAQIFLADRLLAAQDSSFSAASSAPQAWPANRSPDPAWATARENSCNSDCSIEFLIVQVEVGEKLVFLKDEIRDHQFLRPRPQIQRPQLFEPLNQKRKLRLECRPRFSLIKRRQKRVVLRISYALGIEPLGKDR